MPVANFCIPEYHFPNSCSSNHIFTMHTNLIIFIGLNIGQIVKNYKRKKIHCFANEKHTTMK